MSAAFLRSIGALNLEPLNFISLEFWDPIFFVWSIGAAFCFAIGFFISGTAVISENRENELLAQKKLSLELETSLEDQKNLKKLLLHEVKRPLNTISSTLQCIQTETLPQPDALIKPQQLVHQANTYMEGIGNYDDIDSLLDRPNFSPITVSEIANDIKTKWNINVKINDNVGAAHLNVDQFLLDIALGNLIENAMKYGGKTSAPFINIGSTSNEVTFDVIDGGHGIEPEEAANVFKKFYKIGTPSGNALMGCGLGLFVVKRIAEAHFGSARVLQQNPSTLRLTLPVYRG